MTPHPEDKFLELSLLERYCSGTASAEENAQIDVWFGEHPGRRVWYEQLRARLQKGPFVPLSPEEYQSAWLETLRAALQLAPDTKDKLMDVVPSHAGTADLTAQISPEYSGRKLGTGPQTFRIAHQKEGVFSGRTLRCGVWSAATVLVLSVVVAVVGWTVERKHVGSPAAPAMLTYATANGERATITLPDGGTAALDVASRLEIPLTYMAGDHTVRLTGEGLFTVPHHQGTPFTVLAGTTAVRVLGTSFMVRHYASDTTVMVAVREGKVVVHSAVVTTAHLVEVGRDGVPHVQPSDASPFSFATGILTLNGLPLSAAIVELDRWYDVDIRLGDPTLAAQPLKGEFAAGSPDDLQALLELTFDVRVVRDGRVLTLYPRR